MTTTTETETLAPTAGKPLTFSAEERERFRRLHAPAHSDDELVAFFQQCERTQLDPWSRQIYTVRRSQYINGSNVEKAQTMVAIDGLRLQAERSGKYAGQLGPFWCGEDGKWVDVWTRPMSELVAARVGILRKDWTEPCWGVARFSAYAVTTKNWVGSGQNRRQEGEKLNSMWAKMGDTMVAKCAEALGLRKAHPAETSGLYITEEMMQADPAQKDDGDPEPPKEKAPTPAGPRVVVPAKTGETTGAPAAAPKSDPKPAPPKAAAKTEAPKIESFPQLKKEIEGWETVEKANAGIPVILSMAEPERSAAQAYFKAHRIGKGWEIGTFRKDGPMEVVPIDIANWTAIKRAQAGLCIIDAMEGDDRAQALDTLKVRCHENGWVLTTTPKGLAVAEVAK